MMCRLLTFMGFLISEKRLLLNKMTSR